MVKLVTRLVAASVCALLVGCARTGPPRSAAPETRTGPEQAGVLLVARRGLPDVKFRRSVVLLVHHDERGALGAILNRKAERLAYEAVPDVEELRERGDELWVGGPVALDRILVLARLRGSIEGMLPVFDDVHFTFGAGSLRRMVRQPGRTVSYRLYAGHAGWGPGQLENEIARGDWHLVRADVDSVFDERPGTLWDRFIAVADPLPGLEVRGPRPAGRFPLLATASP